MATHPSRRTFLRSSAGVAVGAPMFLTFAARAQNAATIDMELIRVDAARRVLLKGGVVLTLDNEIGDFSQADVLIEDGKIAAVQPEIPVSDEAVAVVDAENRIVVPGFIDTHHHFYQGIIRNILTNGLLNPDYSQIVSDKLTSVYNPSDVHAGALISALGMINNGTTTAVDTSQVNHSPEHSDAAIAALQESGLRVVYAYSRGAGDDARYPQDLYRLRETYFSSEDQLLTLALAARLDEDIFGFAREAGVHTVCHGIADRNEPNLMALGRAGLLMPGDEYIHCTHLSDEAWALIRDTGGHVSLSIPIEMTMGHGMPGILDALEHGVRPSLSSDVDVTMAQDSFTQMRAALTLQRLLVLQRARNGEQNPPPLLTCREVLEFATIEGARCAGLEAKCGTLTPGKDADIVMLKANQMDVWPLNNAPGTVVNMMNPSHVDTVFIAGRAKKWRGALTGINIPNVLRQAEEARDGVVLRAGVERNLLG
jgi:5-methylthioadenosine/S-adenosylhomocysteine deaminase